MVYVVFSYFVILFLFVKKRFLGITSYLVGVYTFSLFFSVWLYKSELQFQHASFLPSVIFCLTLLLYFIPFFKKELRIVESTNSKFIRRFCLLGYVVSGVLLIGSLFLLSKIQEVFAYGLVNSRISMYRGVEIFNSYSTKEHIGHSILKWLCGLSYSVMILFFYAASFIRKKVLLKSLLILSSLSATYLGLLVGGRTNLIYWVLFFIFCVIIFSPYLPKKSKRLIFLTSLVLFSLIGSYFIFITIGRAEYGHGGEAGLFLITYIGQPYLNFCYFLDNLHYHPYTLYRIFPLTSTTLLGRFNLADYRDLIEANSQMDIGIFYTLLGDFFVDVGLVGMLIYSIAYYVVAKRVMKRRVFNLSNLLIVGMLYQIPLHGIFYYSFWKIESSVCVLLTVLMSKYLYIKK